MNRDKDRWVRADEARLTLRALMEEVARGDDAAIYLLRYDRPKAVLVPVDWYEAADAYLSRTEEDEAAFARWRETAAAMRRARRVAGLTAADPRVVNHIDGNPYNNDPANLELRYPRRRSGLRTDGRRG